LHEGSIVSVMHHGQDAEPVIVIDNFAREPQRFIDDAACLRLAPIGDHYPGVRAVVPPRLIEPLLAPLASMIRDTFGLAGCGIEEAYYSLVTTPPAVLRPIQRLPHFDGVEPQKLALLHYLVRDERGGTAFYRHRSTGFERITAARLPEYRRALAEDIARDGIPEPAFIAGDTSLFACVGRHAAAFNRAIIYRGNTLHCADIPRDIAFSADPVTGRFTVNSFLRGTDTVAQR
jgi:hypothetical protein